MCLKSFLKAFLLCHSRVCRHSCVCMSFPYMPSFPRRRESTSQSTPALSSLSFPRKRESTSQSTPALSSLSFPRRRESTSLFTENLQSQTITNQPSQNVPFEKFYKVKYWEKLQESALAVSLLRHFAGGSKNKFLEMSEKQL